MRTVEILLGVVVIILALVAVIYSLIEFRSREYEEPHNITTAGAEDGVVAANVTLVNQLFDEELGWVSIVSDLPADAVVPYQYIKASKTLVMRGFAENQTRRLTITYRYNQLDSYWGSDIIARIQPVWLLLGIVMLVGVGVAAVWPRNRSGE